MTRITFKDEDIGQVRRWLRDHGLEMDGLDGWTDGHKQRGVITYEPWPKLRGQWVGIIYNAGEPF